MSTRQLSRFLIASSLGVLALMAAACGGPEARKIKHLQRGQELLAAGKFATARVEFQNALQIAPQDPEARFEMGVVDEKLEKTQESAQFYQSTIDVSPDHLGARTRLARLFLFSGAPDRAMTLLEPALAKHPDDAELLSIRAAVRVRSKDPVGAQADAERAVQLAPDNEDAVAVLAGIYTSAGEVDKAQALLIRSIEKIPGTIDLRLALAQIYSQEGRTAEDEALLIKLIELRPAESAHRLRLAHFYAGANRVDDGERILREAVKALPDDRSIKLALVDYLAQRRSRETAEKELQAMVAADPADDELKFALARSYEQGQQPAQAEAIYREVIARQKLGPSGLEARDRLASLLVASNKVADAQALIGEVLSVSPRDNDSLFLRSNIALSNQDPRAAIADLRAILRDQPNSVGVLRSLSAAHLANGEPAVAEETLRHAVESNPHDSALKLEFVRLLIQIGKIDQAKPLLAELIKQEPNNISALDTQFRLSMAMKDYPAAKLAADTLVSVQPKSSAGYLYQGIVAEIQHHQDDAIRLYATAAEVQPDALEPLQNEIRLLVAEKRLDTAIQRLDELSQRYPKNPLGPDAKGQVLMGTGKLREAQELFKSAIARDPKWWVAYRDLAAAQLADKDPDAAIQTLQNAQSVVSQPEALAGELASMLQRFGRTDDAISQYEEILKRNPRSDAVANNLAMLLANYKRDQASLDRAKALSARFAESNNMSYLDTYGWVLYRRGEAQASLPVLERVAAQVPKEPLVHYHLGMAQSQVGSTSEARDNLAAAVNSGVKFSGLDEAKATLEKLAKAPSAPPALPRS